MSAGSPAAGVLALVIRSERGYSFLFLSNGFLLPATACYLATRVAGPVLQAQQAAVAVALCLAVALVASQTGAAVLGDRFGGRLAMLETCPLRKSSYFIARVLLGASECAVVGSCAFLSLALFGLWDLDAKGLASIGLVAAIVGSTSCAWACSSGVRAERLDRGWFAVAVVPVLFAALSIAAYRSTSSETVRAALLLSPFVHLARHFEVQLAGEIPGLRSFVAVASVAAGWNALFYRRLPWQR